MAVQRHHGLRPPAEVLVHRRDRRRRGSGGGSGAAANDRGQADCAARREASEARPCVDSTCCGTERHVQDGTPRAHAPRTARVEDGTPRAARGRGRGRGRPTRAAARTGKAERTRPRGPHRLAHRGRRASGSVVTSCHSQPAGLGLAADGCRAGRYGAPRGDARRPGESENGSRLRLLSVPSDRQAGAMPGLAG